MVKTYLINPQLFSDRFSLVRQPSDKMEELHSLSKAIDLDVVGSRLLKVSKINTSTFIGTGGADDLKEIFENLEVDLVVINTALSPIQQRNLEKKWGRKVIDRTGLILEIFGERAQTREGKLQVELASLTYERSRLVRSWTHLERQRGGRGFLGGPGELQIELDRRLLDTRIISLKKSLEKVKQTRALHRKSRQKNRCPHIALVGYTNSGKSTLFNALTGADVYIENLLFATLDPTLRSIKRSGGAGWILSDTVGFISDLPTELVAAFRATLEEVHQANILLHVHDVSNPEHKEQAFDVLEILKMLYSEEEDPLILDVYNKIDLLDEEGSDYFLNKSKNERNSIAISATTGLNQEDLLEKIQHLLSENHRMFEISFSPDKSQILAWFYENAVILKRVDKEKSIFLKVKLDEMAENRFNKIWRSACQKYMRVW
jgi:GTP-binding protein HflX